MNNSSKGWQEDYQEEDEGDENINYTNRPESN